MRKYDPVYLVNEFERSILKELDFLREAKSAEHLRRNFEKDKGVYIPKVYDDYCTTRVIIMEEIKGTRLSEVINSKSEKFDRKLISHRCAQTFFKMVMEDGFYHADMHPGNILVMNRNVIGLIDFGRVGTIDTEVAENIFKIAFYAINDDVNGMVSHLLRTNILSETSETDSLKADLSDVLDMHYSPQIKNIKVGQLLSDLVSVMGKYDFNRPREIAELTSALFILEGMCMRLNPNFNIIEEFEPYAEKLLSGGNFDADKFENAIKENLIDVAYMAKDFPMTLRRFLKKLDEGKIKIELAHRDLDTFTDDLDRLTDKLSMALIFAALIVGSSLIVQANTFLGLFVFVVSSIVGVWLMLRTALG
jgi:ubiquinone biosynthesis protein